MQAPQNIQIMRPKLIYAFIAAFKNLLVAGITAFLTYQFHISWLLLLLIPITAVLIYKCLFILSYRYELSTEQLTVQKGVLNRTVNYLELYRVKDLVLKQSFLERIFNLMQVYIITWDASEPLIIIKGIKYSEQLTDTMRSHIQQCRIQNNVFSFDR